MDELHAHRTRKVFDVLETATGARTQPILWLITTAGFDRSGICYEQRTYLTKILDGVVQDDTYIVDQLSSIDPKTARLKDVADAYRKYGVPMIQSYTQDPTSIGNALLNLATQILRSKIPAEKSALPTNILNTAIQLAVTASKA